MPTDPNIILGAQQPKIEGPMALAGQAMQLKQMGQNLQTGQLQNQMLGTQLQGQQRLYSALGDPNADIYDTDPTSGSKTINPEKLLAIGGPAAREFANTVSEMRSRQAQTQKAFIESKMQGLDHVYQQIASKAFDPNVKPEDIQEIYQNAENYGLIAKGEAAKYMATIPDDPTKLPAYIQEAGMKIKGISSQLASALTGQGSWVNGAYQQVEKAPVMQDWWMQRQMRSQEKGQPTDMTPPGGTVSPQVKQIGEAVSKQIPQGMIERDLGAYNRGLTASGKPPVTVQDPGFDAWYKQMHPSYAQAMAAGQPNPAAGMTGKPLPDPGEEAIARAIAERRQDFLTPNIRTPHWSQINARAASLMGEGQSFPGRAGVAAETRGLTSWEPGQVNGQFLIHLDTTIYHFDLLRQMNKALANNDITQVNILKNKIANEMGYDNVNSFDTVRVAAASEYAKAVAGNQMAEADRAKMDPLFANANGPDKMEGAINAAQGILGGKAKGMDAQYQYDMPGHHVTERMGPETISVLKAHNIQFPEIKRPGVVTASPKIVEPPSAPQPPNTPSAQAPPAQAPAQAPNASNIKLPPNTKDHIYKIQGGKAFHQFYDPNTPGGIQGWHTEYYNPSPSNAPVK